MERRCVNEWGEEWECSEECSVGRRVELSGKKVRRGGERVEWRGGVERRCGEDVWRGGVEGSLESVEIFSKHWHTLQILTYDTLQTRRLQPIFRLSWPYS